MPLTIIIIKDVTLQIINAGFESSSGHICAASLEYLSSRFQTRSDTNLAVQPQKMPRGLKLQI